MLVLITTLAAVLAATSPNRSPPTSSECASSTNADCDVLAVVELGLTHSDVGSASATALQHDLQSRDAYARTADFYQLDCRLRDYLDACTSLLATRMPPPAESRLQANWGRQTASTLAGQQLYCLALHPDIARTVDFFTSSGSGGAFLLGRAALLRNSLIADAEVGSSSARSRSPRDNDSTHMRGSVVTVEGSKEQQRLSVAHLGTHCAACPLQLHHEIMDGPGALARFCSSASPNSSASAAAGLGSGGTNRANANDANANASAGSNGARFAGSSPPPIDLFSFDPPCHAACVAAGRALVESCTSSPRVWVFQNIDYDLAFDRAEGECPAHEWERDFRTRTLLGETAYILLGLGVSGLDIDELDVPQQRPRRRHAIYVRRDDPLARPHGVDAAAQAEPLDAEDSCSSEDSCSAELTTAAEALDARLRQIRSTCGVLCDTTTRRGGATTLGALGVYPTIRAPVDCDALFASVDIDASRPAAWAPPMPRRHRAAFTMSGRVPIEPFVDGLQNEAYLEGAAKVATWHAAAVDAMVKEALAGTLEGNYGVVETSTLIDAVLHTDLTRKRVLVIGSESPWVEAVCLAAGAASVVTLEYGSITTDHPLLSTLTPSEFRAARADGTLGTFDAVVTFSSVEHSGLGRYGDALNPWGDILAIARAWCVTKEDGVLVIGVPWEQDAHGAKGVGRDALVYNAHRVTGNLRYPHLATNWELQYRGLGTHKPHVFTRLAPTPTTPCILPHRGGDGGGDGGDDGGDDGGGNGGADGSSAGLVWNTGPLDGELAKRIKVRVVHAAATGDRPYGDETGYRWTVEMRISVNISKSDLNKFVQSICISVAPSDHSLPVIRRCIMAEQISASALFTRTSVDLTFTESLPAKPTDAPMEIVVISAVLARSNGFALRIASKTVLLECSSGVHNATATATAAAAAAMATTTSALPPPSVLALIFSKNRPFHLDGMLRSMAYFVADAGNLQTVVLYAATTECSRTAYAQLARKHPHIFFVDDQLDGFYATLVDVLHSSNAGFVALLMDDQVWVRPSNLTEAAVALRRRGSEWAWRSTVQLRLSAHLEEYSVLLAQHGGNFLRKQEMDEDDNFIAYDSTLTTPHFCHPSEARPMLNNFWFATNLDGVVVSRALLLSHWSGDFFTENLPNQPGDLEALWYQKKHELIALHLMPRGGAQLIDNEWNSPRVAEGWHDGGFDEESAAAQVDETCRKFMEGCSMDFLQLANLNAPLSHVAVEVGCESSGEGAAAEDSRPSTPF